MVTKKDLMNENHALRGNISRWSDQRLELRADNNVLKRKLELTKRKLKYCEDYIWKHHKMNPKYNNIEKSIKSMNSRYNRYKRLKE